MGLSSGPGYPLSLRCAKCKGVDNGRGYKLRATGRTRPRRPSEASQRIRQMKDGKVAEYECLECGHRGWSKHSKMEDLLAVASDSTGVQC